MQHTKTLFRLLAIVAVFGLATLALPLSAHAGVRVSIGVGLPVGVAPAPVVVAPPPSAVVYPAPAVYGSAPVVVGGYYGLYYRPWRHHPYRWHRWERHQTWMPPFLVALAGKGFCISAARSATRRYGRSNGR
jgi:hypothetical protein